MQVRNFLEVTADRSLGSSRENLWVIGEFELWLWQDIVLFSRTV